MNLQPAFPKPFKWFSLIVLPVIFAATSCAAQVPVDDNGNPLVPISAVTDSGIADDSQLPLYSPAELEALVGPFALYPDDLLAIVLPASTYPLEIVLAARFLEDLEIDNSLQPDESWDESVTALLNYPEIVAMMSEDIESTWQLGEAVISQQSDVLTAIGSFRNRAYAAGNLQSDEYQTVTNNNDYIEIRPVDEKIIYVPYYVPQEVIVQQPVHVYHYHRTPRPVYYYPYAPDYRFSTGFFWGITTAFSIGWSDRYLHVYHPSYSYHPYYGRSYYFDHYYRRPTIIEFNRTYVINSNRRGGSRYDNDSYWRPQRHSSSRPGDSRYRSSQYYADDNPRSRQDEGSRNRATYGNYRDRSGSDNGFERIGNRGSDGRGNVANSRNENANSGSNSASGRNGRDSSGSRSQGASDSNAVSSSANLRQRANSEGNRARSAASPSSAAERNIISTENGRARAERATESRGNSDNSNDGRNREVDNNADRTSTDVQNRSNGQRTERQTTERTRSQQTAPADRNRSTIGTPRTQTRSEAPGRTRDVNLSRQNSLTVPDQRVTTNERARSALQSTTRDQSRLSAPVERTRPTERSRVELPQSRIQLPTETRSSNRATRSTRNVENNNRQQQTAPVERRSVQAAPPSQQRATAQPRARSVMPSSSQRRTESSSAQRSQPESSSRSERSRGERRQP